MSTTVNGGWKVTREKILLFFGMLLITGEFVNAEVLGRPFHYEFLVGGIGLCGVGIAQWKDRH